ncbi:small, acid-soluble spore protein K [Peribacillus saganii]|uniref:Small, acid-soluble spore protein K n=1 Tax=Peribacillus saganii TaxID=2303992 RepID=A0A372LM39_9BACI|nr:small, acid-soluble spore protein K [Peribacillus saganii]RFU68156.1 small, acid-soluble spore protein K [Peribacillus saganii]
MSNKYPLENENDFRPRSKPEYASKRADGTINTNPQERMHASNERESRDAR